MTDQISASRSLSYGLGEKATKLDAKDQAILREILFAASKASHDTFSAKSEDNGNRPADRPTGGAAGTILFQEMKESLILILSVG
jgi:hypothetical protein